MNQSCINIFLIIISTLLLGNIAAIPFSFDLPEHVTTFVTQNPRFISASDHTKLAYYDFMPEKPDAIIIFYHGAGLWSNKLYQYMAQELSQKYNVGMYLFDIRGHGNSQGERGDAPSEKQIYHDISSAINFVKQQHAIPLFLAGHSAGAGLILNYNKQSKHKNVDGYILIAPLLGSRGYDITAKQDDPEKRFLKKLCIFPLFTAAITNGLLCSHTPAIFFNYPESEKQKDLHMLDYYTAPIAQATTMFAAILGWLFPFSGGPEQLFKNLEIPCCVITGQKDEQFIATKIMQRKDYVPHKVTSQSLFYTVPEATHLSVVLHVSDIIALWIQTLNKRKIDHAL
ncbi:MAG TPA: alpha/beta fold hydrolase [Candidatus Babeliales bacterium]|nr:alpha/beta fold hydrolase [Candidatus Babeliales bacterium]